MLGGFLHICTCTSTIYCGLWPLDNTSCIFLTWYQSLGLSFFFGTRNSCLTTVGLSSPAAVGLPLPPSVFSPWLSLFCLDPLAARPSPSPLGSNTQIGGCSCSGSVPASWTRSRSVPAAPDLVSLVAGIGRPREVCPWSAPPVICPRLEEPGPPRRVPPVARDCSPAGPGFVLPRSSRQGLVLAQLARLVSARIGRGQPELTAGGLCFAGICIDWANFAGICI
jgi:hypothetical protein